MIPRSAAEAPRITVRKTEKTEKIILPELRVSQEADQFPALKMPRWYGRGLSSPVWVRHVSFIVLLS